MTPFGCNLWEASQCHQSGFLSIQLAHQTCLSFSGLYPSCTQIQELSWHLSISQKADLVLRRHLINFASLIYSLFKQWIKFHARGKKNQLKQPSVWDEFELWEAVSAATGGATELVERWWHLESRDPSSSPAGWPWAGQKPPTSRVFTCVWWLKRSNSVTSRPVSRHWWSQRRSPSH